MIATCQFCGREFTGDQAQQAVKAHLKACAAYQAHRKAKPVPKGSASGSMLPLGTGPSGVDRVPGQGEGDGSDLVKRLESAVTAGRLRLALSEIDEAQADLDMKAETKERERQRRAELEAEGPRRAAEERQSAYARAEQRRQEQARQEAAMRRRRDRVQAIKQAVLHEPFSRRYGLPDLSAEVYRAIELALSELPVDELPDSELIVAARAARDRIYRKAEAAMDRASAERRAAQERDQQLAERKRRLIQRGVEFAKRELEAVEDLNVFDRYRIQREVERELQDVIGDEAWSDIEDMIGEILDAEGIEFDEGDDIGL